jgi:ATP-binding cassette subfamily B protein/subfamily B ATP-binding cassette protein MsbA
MIQKVSRLAPYARRHWGALSAVVALTAAAAATTLMQPWPMKILVDFAIGDLPPPAWLVTGLRWCLLEPSPPVLVGLAGLSTLALFAVGTLWDVALSWAWMASGQRMVYELAADVFARLQSLSLLFHSRHSVGDSLDRLTTDTWCVYSIVSDLLVAPFQRIITVLGVGVVAWCLNPVLTGLAFGVAPLLAASVQYFGPRLKQRARRGRETQARLTGFVHQTVTALPLVQAFSTEQRNLAQFDSLVGDAVAASQQGVLVTKSFALVNGLANALGHAVVILAGARQVLAGNLSVGSLLVFLAYVRTLQASCEQLLQTYAKLKSAEASLDRLFEILDAPESVAEAPGAHLVPYHASGPGAGLTFEGVSFGYEAGRAVLQGIHLQVAPGERLALVGPSGAGKSTLVSLIPRFFDPWDGRILFNGVDVRAATLDSLRSQISVVLQEPFLLPLSIGENIAYGHPDATREQIIAAAEAAQAHEFIVQLPQAYDGVIGERGSTLSGGQKQRLAIARALVRDTPLVILDEPTSALDPQTETQLWEASERLCAGRTTVVIAHRLSTLRQADRIVVLDQGRVVASGTHDQLLERSELYRRLQALQHGGIAQEVIP